MGSTQSTWGDARHAAAKRIEREKERNDMTVTNGDGAMNGVHEKPSTGVKVSKEVEDLLLWEDPIKSGGILGGATVAYLLFHCSGYSAMYIICNLLLVGVVGTFVWSIIAQLLGKPEFPLPEPKPEAIDKAFACISDSGKTYTNKAIGVFYRIAKGHEPALSLKAGAVLYAMAKVSSMFTLLTLAYIATVGAFAGPKIYTLYREDIDMYVDIAKSKVDEVVVQAKEVLNEKILSKIKPPAKKTE